MAIFETMKDDLSFITILVFLMTTLIEISPIKINPLKFIFSNLGKAINGEVINKLDVVATELDVFKKETKEERAVTYRVRILRFCDDITKGQEHSKDSFNQVMVDIKNYKKYCFENPSFLNDITEMSISKIKETYKNCLDKNSFL